MVSRGQVDPWVNYSNVKIFLLSISEVKKIGSYEEIMLTLKWPSISKINISIIIANIAKRYETFMFILIPFTFLCAVSKFSRRTLYIQGVQKRWIENSWSSW